MISRVLLPTVLFFLALLSSGQTALSQIGPIPTADFNQDGVVNTGDYAIWKYWFGQDFFFGPQYGDATGDAITDNQDYFEWKSQFGIDFTRIGFGGPTISIDLIRDGTSRPVLDSNGRWQFSFSIAPDVGGFANPTIDSPDKGLGSTTAIDLGLQINDEHGFANTAVSNLSAAASGQIYENDPNWDGNAVDALGLDNPGNSPYGGLVDGQGLDAVGHQIDAALGTIFFNSDNGGLGHQLFTFSAGRPAVDSSFGGLTIEVDIDGGYGGYYRLTQDYGTFDAPDADDFFTYTVQAGDVNLDGIVDPNDLLVLESSMGNPGKWTDGDLTGEGEVDATDRDILLAILVPEPVSAYLLVVALGLQSLYIRTR
jgi:Dockerin type I domain